MEYCFEILKIELRIRPFYVLLCFFFSSRRRHTRCSRDWSSDVCSSDLMGAAAARVLLHCEARPDDVVGLPPIPEDHVGIEVAGTVEHQEEALLVLERGRVDRKSVV